MDKYILRNKIYDFWNDYKKFIIGGAIVAIVIITGLIILKKHASTEIYYDKGIVVNRMRYLETNTKTHYVDDGFFVTTDTDERYETQVKILSDGVIFVDSSKHAYDCSIINEPVDVKVVQHYWDGNKWYTTYYVK